MADALIVLRDDEEVGAREQHHRILNEPGARVLDGQDAAHGVALGDAADDVLEGGLGRGQVVVMVGPARAKGAGAALPLAADVAFLLQGDDAHPAPAARKLRSRTPVRTSPNVNMALTQGQANGGAEARPGRGRYWPAVGLADLTPSYDAARPRGPRSRYREAPSP